MSGRPVARPWPFEPARARHHGQVCPRCGGDGLYLARAARTIEADCFRCKGSGRVGVEDRTEGLWDDREDQARIDREGTLHLAGFSGMAAARPRETADRELGYFYCERGGTCRS